jgi:hypothetical protein
LYGFEAMEYLATDIIFNISCLFRIEPVKRYIKKKWQDGMGNELLTATGNE